ncbi:MAG TPA: flotillin-like FloA family protein [Candidatus Tectomicrobia bacterium]|nr:flotillin-like FloA family protein [Candidatus Tectomicrobia bacterium]
MRSQPQLGVVGAGAQAPQAIAEASRQGNIGVRGGDDLRNTQADTHMRESLATGAEGGRQGSDQNG